MAWRKHHPDWPVAAMADQLLMRQRASQKLGPWAERNLLYQRQAYEQSSGYACALFLSQQLIKHQVAQRTQNSPCAYSTPVLA